MTHPSNLLERLCEALEDRRVADGIAMLERAGKILAGLDPANPDAPALTLCVAQWVDLGYRDHSLIRELLAHFPAQARSRMPIADYMMLRVAEGLLAMMTEDADSAIIALDFILQAGQDVTGPRLAALAHFLKGRSHRRKGEYETALHHIVAARTLAQDMNSRKLAAAIQVQEGWLLFQKAQTREALRVFSAAENELKNTDDALSLGNIESARGRIVRRNGEYTQALQHFDRAIAIYSQRDPHHPNVARALVNSAYVKRLIALHLRKRIDSRAARPEARSKRGTKVSGSGTGNYHAKYSQICREALEQLQRAGEIYARHHHYGGSGSVLVNAGHLHLESGGVEPAAIEANKAYELACTKHDHILMARARILQAAIENARVDEQLGEEADTAVHAGIARRYSEEAVALAQQTQNRRLLAGAYIALGMTEANDFFQQWDEAKQCASQAGALLRSDDRDHIWEDLLQLKSRILGSSGIDETLRSWSAGIVGNKTFQQVTEEFAELVIPKVWAREERKVSRVAERLSVSPKKVRRILRNAGLLK